MEKVSFDLPQAKWGTLKSKYKPETRYVTSDEFTAGSYNFVTNVDGSITKRPTDVLYNPIALAAVGKDQFEAIFSNGVHHFLTMVSGTLKYSTGDGIVTTARAGYTSNANMEYAMYQNRVYFDNGIDNPYVYDLTTSYGGVSYTFPTQTMKEMGCQPPVAANTFAADSGTGLTGSYHYKVTFLYYGFEESNGGPASALHTVANKTINLTAIPVGGYGVTARKIYRDANDGNYVLVGTISDNTTTVYADSLSAGTTAIPTENNLPPVFSYIALNLSRLWVAGVSGTPTTLYWSNPGLPDIFDPDNFILCNPKDPIQAVVVYQGTTYILNRHSFGSILGTTDDTFFYNEFPGSVGCVDNRSVQVRTINGVPTLLWLSDRGLYSFNGSSVEYISDPIEDIVNLNIQQVNFVTGSNNQSSLADFQAGTATAGIDLLSNPGQITTYETTDDFQDEADWEGGFSLVNIATADGTNQLKVPTLFTTTLAAGSRAGDATISGSSLVLPTIADFTGASNLGASGIPAGSLGVSGSPTAFAQPITAPTYAGVITAVSARILYGGTVRNAKLTIWSDSLGQPGTILYQGSDHSITTDGTITDSGLSVSISAGTAIWIGMVTSGSAGGSCLVDFAQTAFSGGTAKVLNAGIWGAPSSTYSRPGYNFATNLVSFAFTQTAISSSGSWASPVYDSYSIGSAASANVVNTGSFPTSCSGTLYVDESNDSSMSTGLTTFSQASPNGTYSPGLSNKRYWRMRYEIATTDNRRTPSVTVPSLTFATTGTWISPAIDCTTDVTSYNAITITEDVPAGTTVTVTVATSADNVTYSAYTTVGSATVRRYVRVKIVLTTTSDNANTPGVSLLRFSWNLQSTFTSSIINVGQVPSGWGLFQDVAAAGAGTVAFYMRSAASSLGIAAATFVAVSNGSFPSASVSPLQYVQWKVVITTASGTLPTVDSVTINWFLGNNQSPIRTASLFYDKTYYLAAAETNQTTNNIVISYDQEGNWRIFRDLNVNSLGLFFNQPFYLDAVRPNIYQWLVSPNGLGSAITMDFRTRAFDLGDVLKLKNVRSLLVSGMNTGTTIHAYYSVDRGTTWIEMLNSSGVVGYTTSSDGSKFNEYFVPNYALGSTVSGVTVMFRVTSTDAYPCSILTVKPELFVRKGKYLGRAL
jgi:hypothetical protein